MLRTRPGAVANARPASGAVPIMEATMADRPITMWQLPKLLLEFVPEVAPLLAEKAVKAWDVSNEPVVDDELLAKVGSDLSLEFGPYSLAGWIFLPVFEAALDADPLDEDLVRRCCDFVEKVLVGEEYAAEGIDMMVVENFGWEHARRVHPFAGPVFRAALRSSGWID